MTSTDLTTEVQPLEVPPFPPRARTLASALVHLLGRDDETPARWRSEAFAASVESRRLTLRTVWGSGELDAFGGHGIDGTFQGAVASLAHDPADAAIAIRYLELSLGHTLPAWPDLLRRGVSSGATGLDPALWFG